MIVGTAALNQTPLDWENNRENILEAIAMAKQQQVSLLCLPEMCIPGYGCEDLFLHPWLAEKSMQVVQEITPATSGITVIVGLPCHYNHKIYNVACLLSDGEILGFQAKQHLPKDGVHYEPRWFTPWPAGKVTTLNIAGRQYPFGDRTYTLDGLTLGFEICEDAWVDDRPACRLAEEKVHIILNPSASHFAMMKSRVREQKVIDASAEFSCTYVFANQLGNEAGRIIYDGDALIAHHGELAARTALFSFNRVALTWAGIDYAGNTIITTNIRGGHTSKEEQFVAATALGLFDYLRKSHSHGFVLSLSGGADSATLLVLVTEMIKRGVHALGTATFLARLGLAEEQGQLPTVEAVTNRLLTVAYQATENSSAQTLAAAETLATSVNARFYHWTIDAAVTGARQIIENAIGRPLTWETDDIVLQNIQARSRSPIIWMLANLQNALLLTTSNRSEGSVGYATMDGDTSGSLAPIAGVDKPFIRHWLRWAEEHLGYTALANVNRLTPTAELRPAASGQADEADLMPYVILTKIERLFVLQKLPPLAIHRELSKEISTRQAAGYIIKFFRLWSHNQWKRERLAPSFHLDDYNIDPRSWLRFPILSGSFKNELEELTKLLR